MKVLVEPWAAPDLLLLLPRWLLVRRSEDSVVTTSRKHCQTQPSHGVQSCLSISLLCLLSGLKGRGRRQSLEDEDPSTSCERPAKRSREDAYIKGPMLGQGGFGSVFAGTRSSDGLPVAIKYVTKDEEHENMEVEGQGLLPLEVALMTRVNSAPACPNVLKLLEWFEHPSRYVMILERPDPCQDLHRFCEENGCLDESQAKKVLAQLINALKHCESRGVFHRDVKPQNLLICTDTNDIKLLDFGCGHLLKDSEYKEFAGTLSYAPPEWFRSHSYRARPATVWSLGVTLYNLLCGSLPFRSARRIRRLRFPSHLSAGKRWQTFSCSQTEIIVRARSS
ncbi:hypothetical protein QQF64_009416 [Cirrhinus molitorella]|uniref:non-specific serine/threonine protein kinase n=1 Tax=Cirrhinus molitorella TaxID=172907 RepID=A0ABR3M4I5_9TELE